MIILASRTMAPRNVLNRVVSATTEELNKLKDAVEFYTAACRSIVGYKQLAAKAGIEIFVDTKAKVELPEVKKQMSRPVKRNAVLDKFKVKPRRRYDIVNPNVVQEKIEPPKPVSSWEGPSTMEDLWVPEDMEQAIRDIPVPPMPDNIYVAEDTLNDYVIMGVMPVQDVPTVDFQFFVNEIKKGLQLKATRGREDVAGVVKAVWNKYKGEFVSEVDKAAAKQFCIEVHASFNQLMDEQPRHWFFIPVAHYVNGYFQEAIARCTP